MPILDMTFSTPFVDGLDEVVLGLGVIQVDIFSAHMASSTSNTR
jgi:hypothetical protein